MNHAQRSVRQLPIRSHKGNILLIRVRNKWLLHKTQQLSTEQHRGTGSNRAHPKGLLQHQLPKQSSQVVVSDIQQVSVTLHHTWGWVPGFPAL